MPSERDLPPAATARTAPLLVQHLAEGNTVAVDVRAQTRIGRASRGHLRSKTRPGSGAIALPLPSS